MKVLVVSDVHGYVELLGEVLEKEINIDIILFSGDIAPYKAPYKTLDQLLKAIDIARLYKVKLFVAVPGNMDIADHYEKIKSDIYMNIHNSYKIVGNYVYVGFGGSPKTPFNTFFEFSDEFIEHSLLSLYNTIESSGYRGYPLIFVTHTPPYGTRCDIAYSGNHIGSKGVRKFVEVAKPTFVVCGHVHESRCIDRIGETTIINPGPLYKRYYAVAELEDNKVKVYHRILD
ncbi:MAG: metallophosphoesterase [Ignisphaera sp.]|uniref:YfcE family phosphodiesterase n=1 Tax=Ignisphaera aggregans TaxID=334771 RepID=A0A832FP35_9CREN